VSAGDGDQRNPERPLRGGAVWPIAVGVVAVVCLAAAARVAAVVVLPIVTSIWLAMLLSPIHARLQRIMPGWLAAGCSLGALLLALTLAGSWGWYAGAAALDTPLNGLYDSGDTPPMQSVAARAERPLSKRKIWASG